MPIVSATQIPLNCAIGLTELQAVMGINQWFVILDVLIAGDILGGAWRIMPMVHISFTKIESDSFVRDLRTRC